MVSAQPFTNRPKLMPCKSAQMGSCPLTFLWLWPATDSWYMPTNKIQRRSETAPWSRWWCSQMAGIDSDHSTRKMNETQCWCETALLTVCLSVCVCVCVSSMPLGISASLRHLLINMLKRNAADRIEFGTFW